MSKVEKGDKEVETKEPKVDPAKGAQAANNEFAPNLIGSVAEGYREVAPAPAPVDSNASAADDKSDAQAGDVSEADFLEYVDNVLRPEAMKLGYEVSVKKAPPAYVGPRMYYDPKTGDSKPFDSPETAAGAGFVTGDQMQEIYARRSAK